MPSEHHLGQRYAKTLSGDDFQTPPEALVPLLPYLPQKWKIWEPAAGKGYLVKALRARGFKVIASDIRDGVDFLSYQPSMKYDMILTNPPYSLKDEFIARVYELGKPFALLLPLYGLESAKRQRYWRQGVDILVFDRRINYETPSMKSKSSSDFVSCWFCCGLNIQAQTRVRFVSYAESQRALQSA
ncbi:MAG TPA: tRNA (adenine-N(6)-)-methyltransferase [Phycisphaerae bacterium]|nr:tRNA (adenine-N(6)-)-methyltransferase [Phycisphaerae bacterium]